MTFTTVTTPQEAQIPRDQYGRPLIAPIDGGKPVAYTRVSTLAKTLDDQSALMLWKQRMTAIGLSKRPDLLSLTAAKYDDKKTMNDVVKQAMSAAESDKAANVGTALHRLTELVDTDQLPTGLPAEHLNDLYAYEQAMKPLQVVASEMFVVVDEVQAAGTFDRLVRLPDGRIVVADIKTGQTEPDYPHGVMQQTAIYSRGWIYEHGKGRVARLGDLGVDQSTGLLIHLPAGKGRCDLYLLDLERGWTLAQIAVAVRSAYKDKTLTPYSPAA